METIKRTIQLLLCAFLLLSNTEAVWSQSYCQQQFQLLFRDKATNTVWIGENLYGDHCESSKVIKIETGESGVHISELPLEDFDHWEETDTHKETASLDYVVELDNNKAWEYAIVQLKVKKPAYNAKLMNFYLEELNSVCGQGWNNAMGVNGRLLPKVSAAQTPHLIYFHPEGLYFNYEISKAYYFPDSHYLLVFTHQSTQCHGGGSMHGFLLFQLH